MARKPADTEPDSMAAMKAWAQPAVIVAVLIGVAGIQSNCLESRFKSLEASIKSLDEKIDKKFTHATGRIDKVLETQAGIARSLGKVESSTSYMRARVDKIADKLDVAAVVSDKAMIARFLRTSPLDALEGAGFKVHKAEYLFERTATGKSKLKDILGIEKFYFFDPKDYTSVPKKR